VQGRLGGHVALPFQVDADGCEKDNGPVKLNHTTLNDVFQRLTASGYFESSDFRAATISLKGSYPTDRFRVVYVHNEDYCCDIYAGDPRWGITQSPGAVEATESFTLKTKEELLNAMLGWSQRLEAELRITPAAREHQRAASELVDIKAKLDQVEDSVFSKVETAELEVKLQEMKRDISEQIKKGVKKVQEGNKDLERKLAQLERDVQFLRDQLHLLTKRNWAAVMVERLRKYFPSLRELGVWARATKFLGPSLGVPPEVIDTFGEVLEAVGDQVPGVLPES
jgi:hypothetical protein